MSEDRQVRQRLQHEDDALYSRFRHAEEEIRHLLEYSQAGEHLMFTTHGVSHVLAVEKAYDWLLSGDDIMQLSPIECYCLLVATLLHDALMIPRTVGDEGRARRTHATEPRDYLIKHGDRLGINQHEAWAIGEIIRAHHVDSISDIPDRTVLGDSTVDLRKLGACLSLADICHADSSRAPQIVFNYLNFDEESAHHWRRHLDIGGVVRPQGSDELLISALVFSDEGERAVNEYVEEVRAQLKRIVPYFSTELAPISKVDVSLTRLSSPVDRELRFKTDMSAILRILIEGVYERSDVFIRELVQNGLDATYVRAAQAIRRNESYDPLITVTSYVDSGDKCCAVRVDDNGAGMDFTQVQDMLLLIGGTSTDSDSVRKLLKETTQRNLIATFGIGLLSCLKVASCIVIETARAGATPVKLTISGVDDRIVSSEAPPQDPGTSIYVELADEYRSEIDVDGSFFHYFMMVEQADLRLLDLPWSEATADLSRETIMASAVTEGLSPFSMEAGGFARTDISGDDYRGWVWFMEPEEGGLARDASGDVVILNDGVYVATDSADDWFPPYLHMCEGVLNFSARAVDLPVSRDRVMQNQRLDRKKQELAVRCGRTIATLSELTKDNRLAEAAALLTAAVFRDANEDHAEKLTNGLEQFTVGVVGGRSLTLKEVCEQSGGVVYVAYPEGRLVKPLVKFDGKQLFHKEDDIVSLQSRWLSQQGKLVLKARIADESEFGIREIDVLRRYLASQDVKVVDLTEERPIQGQERSRPVRKESRSLVGASIKFVEFQGLAASRGWRVGAETWLNVANPDVAMCYETLNSDAEKSKTFLAALAVKLIAQSFDDVLADIVRELKLQESAI